MIRVYDLRREQVQVRHIHTPHLALIPFAGGSHSSSSIFWTLPSEDEFEPIDGHKLSHTPLGRIPSHYLNQLEVQYNALPAHSNLNADPKIRDYRRTFRQLVDRLNSPATFIEALMAWRIAQRNCLELEARILWINEVKPESAQLQSWEVHPLREVVGAITDKLTTAEHLYRVGLSCFFLFMCAHNFIVLGGYSGLVLSAIRN